MTDLTQDKQQTSNTRADGLNRQCYYITLDRTALDESFRKLFLDAAIGVMAVPQLTQLFSNTLIFVPTTEIEAMERIFQAIESATELSHYRERVLS